MSSQGVRSGGTGPLRGRSMAKVQLRLPTAMPLSDPFGGTLGQADTAVVEEGRKGGQALHHVIHGLGDSTGRRELGLLGPHPPLQALDQRADAGLADDAAAFRRLEVEFTLDAEDRVDALHRLNGHRRPHGLGEIGQVLRRTWHRRGLSHEASVIGAGTMAIHIEGVEAGIGIDLEYLRSTRPGGPGGACRHGRAE